MEAFNHERFFGLELEAVAPVLEACAQLPFGGSHRLVEVEDADAIGKKAEKERERMMAALVEYVVRPNPTTVLVLSSSTLDGRSKLVKAAAKSGVACKFEPIGKDRDAIAYVLEQARQANIAIDRDAAALLVELVGTGSSQLLMALERAALHAGSGQAIARRDVEAVAGHSREAIIFALTDAVGLREPQRALEVLAELFRAPAGGAIGQFNACLAMLIRHVRLLFAAHAVGGRPQSISAQTGVPPFVATRLAAQVRGWNETDLRGAFAGLERLDRDIKGGSLAVARAPYVALQRWILEVCGGLPGASARAVRRNVAAIAGWRG
jgi:DNA polymerase-3 subunit delta